MVYAHIDPVAIAHSKVILDGNYNAAVIDAYLREPQKILGHEVVGRLIRSVSPPAAARRGAALHLRG